MDITLLHSKERFSIQLCCTFLSVAVAKRWQPSLCTLLVQALPQPHSKEPCTECMHSKKARMHSKEANIRSEEPYYFGCGKEVFALFVATDCVQGSSECI